MKEILDFLLSHWYLSGPLAGLLVILTIVEILEQLGAKNRLDPSQLTRLINREDALIYDLRDHADYKNGHVVGSKQMSDNEVLEQVSQLQKNDKPLVLIDKDGRQAVKVSASLISKGIEKVFILEGGIEAWKKAGMPLAKLGG